jgi:1,4-dihydroxy-2-naphthoyl-CoA hydrolase
MLGSNNPPPGPPSAGPAADEGRRVAVALNEQIGGMSRAMGMTYESVTPDRVEASLVVGDEHRQAYGIVHGGVHCALIETTCSTGAALSALPTGLAAVGLENHTSFLRAAREGVLSVVATPVHKGGRSQVWEATVRDDKGRPVATGRVRLLCIDPTTEVGGRKVGLGPGDAAR